MAFTPIYNIDEPYLNDNFLKLLPQSPLTGDLTTENLIPQTNNESIGTSLIYYKDIFALKHYFNSTAYIDGSIAGSLTFTGILARGTNLISGTGDIGSSTGYVANLYNTKHYFNSTANIDGATAGSLTFTGILARGTNLISGTGNIGSSTGYVANLYNTKHYFNSTANIDGANAGVLQNNATVYANPSPDVNQAGIPFMFGLNGQALKTIFLSVGSSSGHNVWAQSQWNANVTALSGQYDSNYPGVQMLLGLGTNYGANGSISFYCHPATSFSDIYNFFSTADTGTVLGNQKGAYYPRVASSRLDIYCELASKIGLKIRAYTSQTADLLQFTDHAGTTILSKFDKDAILTCAGYKSSDGSTGITTTQTFLDSSSVTKTMTIKNGLITGIA